MFQVASGLFLRPFGSKRARRERVIYQMVDGRIRATDGARVAMLHGNGAELHRLGIEGEQTVRQEFAYTCEILQGLSSLDGAQHTSDGT